MKNAVLACIAILASAFILAGCGGGGAPTNEIPQSIYYNPYVVDLNPITNIGNTDPSNPDSDIPLTVLQSFINTQNSVNISLVVSANTVPDTFTEDFRNIIVRNANAGDRYKVEFAADNTLISPPGTTVTAHLVVFNQGPGITHYLAINCADENDEFCLDETGFGSYVLKPSVFSWESDNYEVDGRFYFNRGLTGAPYHIGNFRIDAENKHLEYGYSPFAGVGLDGGFKYFDDKHTGVTYAKMQYNRGGFFAEYTAGNVNSNYYKEGAINGYGIGYQTGGFALKFRKPFGGIDKHQFSLFYKKDIQ